MAAFFKSIKRQYLIVVCILLLVYSCSFLFFSFNTASSNNKTIVSQDTSSFAGSLSCMSCHKDIYESHIKTAHYHTSAIASEKSIKGSFKDGQNRFRYNKFMEVAMEKKADSFFQSAYINGTQYQSEQFGVVIGSGRKGQTFLYWKGNELFQLPVSYYVPAHSWCNSPGYPATMVYFDRPIKSRCIECHGTYASTAQDANGSTLFDPSSMIYGIDCERCHGPSSRHVQYHAQHPGEKKGMFVINAKLLSRQQRMDACALCHSGFRKEVKPPFSFAVGDKLEDFSLPNYNEDSSMLLDVHGNQYGLLTSSKCYLSSTNMDCSSCHNVHKEEINNPKLYSSKCMNCHNEASHNFCTLSPVKGMILADNCIDCHMPALPSKKIFLQMAESGAADLVRTHRVAIYKEQSDAFIAKLKNKK